MSEYFSTKESVETLIMAHRLAGFIDQDGDGAPDTLILEAGFKRVRSVIRGYIKPVYDTDVIDAWTDTTCPELIGYISDMLCARVFYGANPRFREVALSMYDEALQMLKDIRNGDMDIYSLDRDTSHIADLIETGRTDSDFDPEREQDDMTVRTTWVLPDNRDIEG